MDDKQQLIRDRAYRIWKDQGEAHGRDEEHWAQAEREIDSGYGDGTTTASKNVELEPAAVPANSNGRAKKLATVTSATDDGNAIDAPSRAAATPDPLAK